MPPYDDDGEYFTTIRFCRPRARRAGASACQTGTIAGRVPRLPSSLSVPDQDEHVCAFIAGPSGSCVCSPPASRRRPRGHEPAGASPEIGLSPGNGLPLSP